MASLGVRGSCCSPSRPRSSCRSCTPCSAASGPTASCDNPAGAARLRGSPTNYTEVLSGERRSGASSSTASSSRRSPPSSWSGRRARRVRLRAVAFRGPRGAVHAVRARPAVPGRGRDPAAVHPDPRARPAGQPARRGPAAGRVRLPLTIVILRPFFRSIPVELEDAARIDGCGTFGFFWRVLLPLSRPALATVAVLAVVASWNAFLLPLLVLSGQTSGRCRWAS